MFTIYLIEILTTICWILFLGIVGTGIGLTWYIIEEGEDFEDYKDKLNTAQEYLMENKDSEEKAVKAQIKYYEDLKEWAEHNIKAFKKNVRNFIVTIAVLIGLFIVTPSTRTAYRIWGIGSVVEYVRENPTAQGLPDKVIDRLDKWLDKEELTDVDDDIVDSKIKKEDKKEDKKEKIKIEL